MKQFLMKLFKKDQKKEETISLSEILSNLVKVEAVSNFGKMRLV